MSLRTHSCRMRALARHFNNKAKEGFTKNATFPDSLELLRILQSSMFTVHKDQDGPLLVFNAVCRCSHLHDNVCFEVLDVNIFIWYFLSLLSLLFAGGFSPVGQHLGRAPSLRLQTVRHRYNVMLLSLLPFMCILLGFNSNFILVLWAEYFLYLSERKRHNT